MRDRPAVALEYGCYSYSICDAIAGCLGTQDAVLHHHKRWLQGTITRKKAGIGQNRKTGIYRHFLANT